MAFTWFQYGSAASVVVLVVLLADLLLKRRSRISLKGKVVVITGGSSGIGLASAKAAARQGATVVIMARRKAVLDSAKAEIESAAPGARVVVKASDVADNERVAATFAEIIKEEHQIDVLLCCAGISVAKKFEDTTDADFKRLLNINVLGCVNCVRGVLSHMKRRGSGRIALVSSAAGQVGIFGYTGYSASKFALRGFAEALQMEARPHNIAVSLAFPPDVNTPMLAEEDKTKPAETKEIAGTVSVQQPDAIAAALISGIRAGRFFINFDLLGNLLGFLSAGFAPTVGIVNNLLGIVLAPVVRIVALALLWHYDGICLAHHTKAKKQA